jgi:medium-chain acyl-[acyl-carrier-protein] hydrolase
MKSLRLYCFPYGGAGASLFRGWSKLLPESISVIPMQFPGREERFREEPVATVQALVDDLRPSILSAGPPFAFFGHSLGALVSFELARDLRKRRAEEPQLLFMSGCPAPHLSRLRPRISGLGQREFIAALLDEFDVAAEVREEPVLLDYAYPVLRADFAAVESYKYEESKPLTSQIVVFGGEDDREARYEQLQAWSEHSLKSLKLHMFPGGHFFVNSARAELFSIIEEECSAVF